MREESYENERRRWDRIHVSVPLFVRGSDNGEGKSFLHFVTAVNISAGGLLIVSRSYLPAGCEVTIEFPELPLLPESAVPESRRKLQARVVRAVSDKASKMALEFAEPLAPPAALISPQNEALQM